MKKQFFILTGLFSLMLFVLAGCGEKNQQQEQKQTKNEVSQEEKATDNESSSVKGTFKELIGQGRKIKCEFSFENQENQMSGVAYTDGDKMYQKVLVNQADMEIETNIIVKDNQIYTWNSMQPDQGMKMNLSEFENNPEMIEESETSTTNPGLNQSFEYKCEPWQVDNKKFDVPADKSFMDMNSFMKGQTKVNQNAPGGNPTNPGTLNKQACDACQYTPDPDECLKELGC
jgi:hypothetical protein